MIGAAVPMASPASAATFADKAETYSNGVVGGWCKGFVNDVVRQASGGSISLTGYQSGFASYGTEVTPADATKGDIIQITPAGSTDATAETMWNSAVTSKKLHTAIILSVAGSGVYNVIDSNSDNVGAGGHVQRHQLNPSVFAAGSIIKIWRLGTTTDSPVSIAPLHVEKLIQPDGIRQVYSATQSHVYETWWWPGMNPQTTAVIHIAQNNIVGFDKTTLADGTQVLYAAVPDGIWETYWRPGLAPQSAKIIGGKTGIKDVIVGNKVTSNVLTHRLYVLRDNGVSATSGPFEYWWQDGGDGIHEKQLAVVNNPITMIKRTAPNGNDQTYTASTGAVWETSWTPGAGNIATVAKISISQNDIVDVDKKTLANGTQELYTATRDNGVWKSIWTGTGSPAHTRVFDSLAGVKSVHASLYSGVHQIYVATGNKIYEYWWHATGSGSSVPLTANSITDFVKATDDSTQQVYYTDNRNVIEGWWTPGALQTALLLPI